MTNYWRRLLPILCQQMKHLEQKTLLHHTLRCRPVVLEGTGKYSKPTLTNSIQIRHYAKKKEKGDKKSKHLMEVKDEEMAEIIDFIVMKENMEKVLIELRDNYVKHLGLRTSAGSLDTIIVEFEDKKYPLNQLAQITMKNPHLVVLNMNSFPQAIPAALIALQQSGMNLSPQREATTVYIPLPKITKEHREKLAKGAKDYFHKAKDQIQTVQSKYIKNIKKIKEGYSEDFLFSVQKQIYATGEDYISQAEKLMTVKQNELLAVQ